MSKRKYVVGFMFNDLKQEVVLIKKRHGPPRVIGNWNGVGGHVELGEHPHQTIVREFDEETGVLHTKWEYLCSLDFDDHIVYFFFATSDEAVDKVQTMTDEIIYISDTENLPEPIMHNLTWMIPFLRDPDVVPFLGQVYMLGTDK